MAECEAWDVAVIGAGASGLMAALGAAERKRNVIILDRNREPGRKILASGNGRCNLTNLSVGPQHYPSTDPAFIEAVLKDHDPEWLRNLFRNVGLETVVEGERVWPASFEARSVRDRLVRACLAAGANLRTNVHVETVVANRDGFRISIRTIEGDETYVLQCRKVVIAAGGKSYKNLGATDSGYDLAAQLGHRIAPLYPGLVPLKTEVSVHHKLQGLKVVADIALVERSDAETREIARVTGDLLFADYGVSGQAILNLSCLAGRELTNPADTDLTLTVNFLPGRDTADVAAWLGQRRDRRPEDPVLHDLEGFLPRKLAAHILERARLGGPGGSGGPQRLIDIGEREISRLAEAITAFIVPVKGTRAFGQAMITVGGVDTGEIDPGTMSSRKVPGLFLAGEVLNVQGLSGGFNLHFAFASGYRAGAAAAE